MAAGGAATRCVAVARVDGRGQEEEGAAAASAVAIAAAETAAAADAAAASGGGGGGGGELAAPSLSDAVRQFLERLWRKAEAYVCQRPLLPEDAPPGLIAIVARRTSRCRAFLLGASAAASAAEPESSAAKALEFEAVQQPSASAVVADACLLFVTETLLVHYSKRARPTMATAEGNRGGAPSLAGDVEAAGGEDGPGEDDAAPSVDEKYWKRRYNYFSRFDDGVRMDAGAWFEVTPESVARHIADRMKYGLVVDGTCGVGGNAIQFALSSDRVIGVDVDAQRLSDARHNAGLYGVSDRIEFVHDDFVNFAATYSGQPVDAVFLSPPWGGPAHLDAEYFSLKDVVCPDIVQLFTAAASLSTRVVLYLPRHTNLHEIVILAAVHGYTTVEVEKVLFKYPSPHLKLIVVHFTPEAAAAAAGGVCEAVRHKSVGAEARGCRPKAIAAGARGSPETMRRNLPKAARGPCCDNESLKDTLLRLPPLAGPIIRALHCRHHYIGRYVVALAFALERRDANRETGARPLESRNPCNPGLATSKSRVSKANEASFRREPRQFEPGSVVHKQAIMRGAPERPRVSPPTTDIAVTICKGFVAAGDAEGNGDDEVNQSEFILLVDWLLDALPLAEVLRLGEQAESDRVTATAAVVLTAANRAKGPPAAPLWSSCLSELVCQKHPDIYERLLERRKAAVLAASASAA